MSRSGTEIVEISEVVRESSKVKTLYMEPGEQPRWSGMVPGQFIMVWIPGVDEIPMSVSYLDGDPLKLGITVQDVGEATKALCRMGKGDKIGIRGPYGNGFDIPTDGSVERLIGVSGGVGAASTVLALERAREDGLEVLNLVGARSEKILIYWNRWNSFSDRLEIATDDGSTGHHGLVTDLLDEELSKMDQKDRESVMVVTCGPELMMKNVHALLKHYGVKGLFSLERLMKCGIGLCDSCAVSGIRVCQDGPVFDVKQLDGLKDFGVSQRDTRGKLISIRECV